MKKISFIVVLLLPFVLTTPTFAWEGIEISSSVGSVDMYVSVWGSPIPGYCSWDSSPTDGPTFLASNTDGSGNSGCPAEWIIRCDIDSLGFSGEWPAIPATNAYAARYDATIECTVNVISETRLVAEREVVGNLDTSEHNLSIRYPDGSIVELLSSSTGENKVTHDLQPGEYQVVLEVLAYQSNYPYGGVDPYDGRIRLVWLDPNSVAVGQSSWGGLKAIFR